MLIPLSKIDLKDLFQVSIPSMRRDKTKKDRRFSKFIEDRDPMFGLWIVTLKVIWSCEGFVKGIVC